MGALRCSAPSDRPRRIVGRNQDGRLLRSLCWFEGLDGGHVVMGSRAESPRPQLAHSLPTHRNKGFFGSSQKLDKRPKVVAWMEGK
ncbi:large ribosomal subunit protein mL51 isoform X2 [Anolis carolinensis]|uniref:large ribosomal subunit protein mL51 isoform X2 n=1 Tax=Anolis carolinensis TaxID=28377 RepID=UPI002F2B7710